MTERRESEGESAADREVTTAKPRSGTLNGGMDAREMARRSAASRKANASARAAEREDAAGTVRQRLAVALSSELTTEDWKKVVAKARDEGKVADLARMADQAFGKPQPEEDAAVGEHDDVRALTRAQRGALIASLMEEEETQRAPSGDSSDPREAADDEAPLPGPPAPPEVGVPRAAESPGVPSRAIQTDETGPPQT